MFLLFSRADYRREVITILTEKQKILKECDEIKENKKGAIRISIEYYYGREGAIADFDSEHIDLLIWVICNSFDKNLMSDTSRIKGWRRIV